MNRSRIAYAATLLLTLTACSKPAEKAADATASEAAAVTADASAAGADAAGGAAAPGGAISPPASNAAVDTSADADAPTTPASNSFTEGQARDHIQNAGYTDVSSLTKTADGMWSAKAKKDGKTVDVALDFKGAVTAK